MSLPTQVELYLPILMTGFWAHFTYDYSYSFPPERTLRKVNKKQKLTCWAHLVRTCQLSTIRCQPKIRGRAYLRPSGGAMGREWIRFGSGVMVPRNQPVVYDGCFPKIVGFSSPVFHYKNPSILGLFSLFCGNTYMAWFIFPYEKNIDRGQSKSQGWTW